MCFSLGRVWYDGVDTQGLLGLLVFFSFFPLSLSLMLKQGQAFRFGTVGFLGLLGLFGLLGLLAGPQQEETALTPCLFVCVRACVGGCVCSCSVGTVSPPSCS